MKIVKLLGLLIAVLGSVTAFEEKINPKDYIFWKLDGIRQWHTFFPSRYLQEEQLTIDAMTQALTVDITDDLEKILSFQYTEFDIQQQQVLDTAGEGCMFGIKDYLDDAVKKEAEGFQFCTGNTPVKLAQIQTKLKNLNNTYQASYKRAMEGIKLCAKKYHNRVNEDRMLSCVEYVFKEYIRAADKTRDYIATRPAMTYFLANVVKCSSIAAQNIALEGKKFLEILANCASVGGKVDKQDLINDFKRWKGLNDTLVEQFMVAEYKYKQVVKKVEKHMEDFYKLKKIALETFVVKSREEMFYEDKIRKLLQEYYKTLVLTANDNPTDKDCVDEAKVELDRLIKSGANESETCDQAIVTDSKILMAKIYDNFVHFNTHLPTVGDVALLQCFAQSYDFAPNTIINCFKLKLTGFDIEYTDLNEKSENRIVQLNAYVTTFFGSDDLPCGNASVRKMYLKADKALYDLQRCLYRSSGTAYAVTVQPHDPTESLDQTVENFVIYIDN